MEIVIVVINLIIGMILSDLWRDYYATIFAYKVMECGCCPSCKRSIKDNNIYVGTQISAGNKVFNFHCRACDKQLWGHISAKTYDDINNWRIINDN